ncbi:MAG: hypothetical protein GC152_02305 [Alphaproteobacteria bacterium]|nr:hypothetical protein [Alphaproteobacteria bacterium]
MKQILLIAWREYRQYVFSRGFLLFLILTPVVVVAATVLLSVVDRARPERTFVVVDQAGDFIDLLDADLTRQNARAALQAWNVWVQVAVDREVIEIADLPAPYGAGPITNERIEAFLSAGGADAGVRALSPYLKAGAPPFIAPKARFARIPAPPEATGAATSADAAAALEPYLVGARRLPGAGDELFAAVIIPDGFAADANAPSAEYWSRNVTDPTLQMSVTRALRDALRRRAAADLGLERGVLDRLADIDAPIASFTPGASDVADAAIDDTDRLEKVILPGVMTYALLVVVFAVGNPLLTNTIEERSNKIVEVLLSSATADQLMAGKLLGIAAVGLTVPTILLAGGLAASLAAGPETEFIRQAMTALFRSNLIFAYLFYFLSAYVIFAMIFLAIGALSNSLQDAQAFMGPLMMIVFAPMPFAIMVFQNPNGLAATILTFIPIYTPYAVMLRIAADPPFWEIAGGTALMLAFAGVVARVMGRIFRNNILNAAPPRAKEIWKIARPRA